MGKLRSIQSCICISILCGLFSTCQTEPANFKSIDDLPNPGRGWATHSSFNNDHANLSYPESTVAYFRFTWRQAEPTDGGFAFDVMDGLIAQAHSQGQKIAFRITPDSCTDGFGIPDWLAAKGINGWNYTGTDWSACFSPDAADPVFMSYAHRLIDAFGARYNGNPDIDTVDIGLVGDYGEWHCTAASAKGAVMPPYSVRTQYIDWYFDAFPNSRLIMLPGNLTQTDADTLVYAVSRGAGWRADSWGDYRQPYNHMEDNYPIKFNVPGIPDAWRTRPVVLETGGIVSDWYFAYPDRLQDAFDFAVAYHASVLNGKSAPMPEAWVTALTDFTSRIGYRFRLAAAPVMPASAARGTAFTVSLTWTNMGNAPVYRPYTLAVRLLRDGTEISRGLASEDVRTWMPRSTDGVDYAVNIAMSVPANAMPGAVTVQTALLDQSTGEAAIQFAMDGRNPDLWYDLGTIVVQ
jgi:hypothetical protein